MQSSSTSLLRKWYISCSFYLHLRTALDSVCGITFRAGVILLLVSLRMIDLMGKEEEIELRGGSLQGHSKSNHPVVYTPPSQIFIKFFLQHLWTNITTVSYTHLDVYKRQELARAGAPT